MTPSEDSSRYTIVARDLTGRWHNVHLGTLTPEQAETTHTSIMRHGALPGCCQIWEHAEWLAYEAKQLAYEARMASDRGDGEEYASIIERVHRGY